VGGHQGEIVHVREHQPSWDPEMEGCYVDDEKERGDGGALRGTKVDGSWGTQRTLENQGAVALALAGSNPGDEIQRDPTFREDAGQSQIVDVVKAGFDVQENGGHLQAPPLESLHVVHEGEAGIICPQPRKGAALV